MLVALVLVPQEQSLRTAEIELAPLQFEQDLLQIHQARYDHAIFELDREDPAVMERLIRAKLQLIPVIPSHDVEVLAVSNAINQPVTDWIHRLIEFERPIVTPPRTTALASLVGPGIRLWVVGGATLSIFIGLVLGSPGEPLVREAARKILRIPAVFESETAQPHLFGEDEEAEDEEAEEEEADEEADEDEEEEEDEEDTEEEEADEDADEDEEAEEDEDADEDEEAEEEEDEEEEAEEDSRSVDNPGATLLPVQFEGLSDRDSDIEEDAAVVGRKNEGDEEDEDEDEVEGEVDAEEEEGEEEGEDEDIDGKDEDEEEEADEDVGVDEEEDEEEDEDDAGDEGETDGAEDPADSAGDNLAAELTYEPVSDEGSLWADLEDQGQRF